jgi:hypothetical protein
VGACKRALELTLVNCTQVLKLAEVIAFPKRADGLCYTTPEPHPHTETPLRVMCILLDRFGTQGQWTHSELVFQTDRTALSLTFSFARRHIFARFDCLLELRRNMERQVLSRMVSFAEKIAAPRRGYGPGVPNVFIVYDGHGKEICEPSPVLVPAAVVVPPEGGPGGGGAHAAGDGLADGGAVGVRGRDQNHDSALALLRHHIRVAVRRCAFMPL